MKLMILLLLLVSCSPFVHEFVGAPIAYDSGNFYTCSIRFVLRGVDRETQNRVTKTKLFNDEKYCSLFRELIKKEYGTFYYIRVMTYRFTGEEILTIEKVK